jgi:hypothetical protein
MPFSLYSSALHTDQGQKSSRTGETQQHQPAA